MLDFHLLVKFVAWNDQSCFRFSFGRNRLYYDNGFCIHDLLCAIKNLFRFTNRLDQYRILLFYSLKLEAEIICK